jgi:hypothetical protein
VRATAALLSCLLLATACGSDDDDGGGAGMATGGGSAADLTVTVWPGGRDGRERTRRIECAELGAGAAEAVCRRLGGLTPERLAPVPPRTACTEIYGGPAVARVEGTLRGDPVSARFNRVNGCEIERWDRNRELLGSVPARP